MDILFIVLLALSLSTDSFAVSLALGVTTCRLEGRGVRLAVMVGVMHFVLCALGVMLFSEIGHYIVAYGNYVAFALLGLLGVRMVVEGVRSRGYQQKNSHSLTPLRSFMVAVAVSLDAFVVGGAVGVTDAYTHTIAGFLLFSGIIGFTSALSVLLGIALGCRLSSTFRGLATIIGGVSLVVLGLKILLF